jgi:CTP-dependent riboflavin kinase
MITVVGKVGNGLGHFRQRMTQYPEVFRNAAGEDLYPGTLNVELDRQIPIKEGFRIRGADIGEPDQDLQFEVCRLGDIRVFRIRPLNLITGDGGHGDHILEIASKHCLKEHLKLTVGNTVEITLLRDDI